jgi:hypothetical protein
MIGSTSSLVDGNTPGFAQSVPVFPNQNGADIRLADSPVLPAVTGAPLLVPAATRGTSIVVFRPDLDTGYVQHFNFTVQRELLPNSVIEAGWVRTKGVKLFNWVDINQPRMYGDFLSSFRELQAFASNNSTPVSTANTLVRLYGTPAAAVAGIGPAVLRDGLAGTAADNLDRTQFGRYAGAGVSPFYLRPYPQFNQLLLGDQDGRSWYDSLQVSFRRSTGKVRFNVNYTWSKSLDNTSVEGNGFTAPIDNANMSLNKARGTFDRPHNLNWNAIYVVPFGRQGKYWTAIPGWLDRVAGGWEAGALGLWQSGGVFGIQTNRRTGPSTTGGGSYIDYAGDRNIGAVDRRGNGIFWFTPAQVSELTATTAFPAAGGIGTSGRNAFRGPRFFNVDLSLVKKIAIIERHSMTFRAEFYNLFNNVNFANPAANIATPQSVGRIQTTLGNPRIVQLGLRYDF